jgi:hypothetical protein|tara:strand:+ start:685 stop:786 length:102 start_codon:yes stop_codon:yes gene_type:complete
MKDRRMTGDELFRMIDVDKNNVCSLTELEEVLK